MKTLKIKLGLFSLLAILAGSIFLTSCEQEVVSNPIDTLLTDEQLVLAFEQDENVTRFAELAEEQLATFTEKIKENNVDVDQIKALHIAGDYETLYTMLNIDATEFENQTREIEQLAAQIKNDHPALMECTSCADNKADIDAQYEALQVSINTEIQMRGCSWKYYACMATCAGMPPGLRVPCFAYCAAVFCT